MLPLRASIIALALLAGARAAAGAQEAMPAAAAPAPEGMAAVAPAPEAENPLVSQYRLSPEQVAVIESLGLTDPQSIMVSGLLVGGSRGGGDVLPDRGSAATAVPPLPKVWARDLPPQGPAL